MFFVNLPLRYCAREPFYLDYFLTHSLCPELGIDAFACDSLDMAWHETLARTFAETGLATAVHLPFDDLRPASCDPLMAEASRERLLRAVRIARIYAPRHMVGHASFSPPASPEQAEQQFEAALATWRRVLAAWPDHPPLYLENTHDAGPERLAGLVSALRGLGLDVGVCLDVGHWHSFSQGVTRRDLSRWFAALSPFIGHVHLHDNRGEGDEHLGLGQGSIPWGEFFDLVEALPKRPTATLEPHTKDALRHSEAFIAEHSALLARLFRPV